MPENGIKTEVETTPSESMDCFESDNGGTSTVDNIIQEKTKIISKEEENELLDEDLCTKFEKSESELLEKQESF